MQPLIKHTGLPVVLNQSDIDTDQIIPKQFLKKIERTGFGHYLFYDWRYLDADVNKVNPNFELNQERYQNASILISGKNFGSGSSREHAQWALQEYGFRVLLASSFADIFYNNCFKNGILPIVLDEKTLLPLKNKVLQSPGKTIQVDLPNKVIIFEDEKIQFTIDDFRKNCLINGWNDIDLTLQREIDINKFLDHYRKNHAYLFSPLMK